MYYHNQQKIKLIISIIIILVILFSYIGTTKQTINKTKVIIDRSEYYDKMCLNGVKYYYKEGYGIHLGPVFNKDSKVELCEN